MSFVPRATSPMTHESQNPPPAAEVSQSPPPPGPPLDVHGEEKQTASTSTSGSKAKSKKPLSFYMTFVALNICVLIVSMDATVLSVSLPVRTFRPYFASPADKTLQVIANKLNGTALESFWASLCFLLAVVVAMPIITSLSDVLGRKPPLYASFVLFLAGSVVFAVADNMGVLILGRTLQGLGGGGIDVLGEVILADITSLKERGLYLGLFSVPMAGGAICGPLVGAALAEKASWRWIGWINLPLGVTALLLFVFFLRLRTSGASMVSNLSKLDWVGMVLYLIGSALLSLPLSWAGSLYPWGSYRTLVPFILGIVVLVIFGCFESRPGQPIFPYRVFASRTAGATLVGSFMHGGVLNGGLLYLLLSFQATFLDTPFRSAVEVLPICVFIVVFSIIGALSVEILRRYRLILVAAWPCLAVGVGLLALWRPGASDGMKYGPQVLAGVGLGIIFTITTFPMNASQRVDDAGLAIGIMVSFRMFGSMTGLAIGSTVFNSIFAQHVARIGQLSGDLATLRDVSTAIAFIPRLREVDRATTGYDAVMDAYQASLMAVFIALAAMGALGAIASLFTRELSLENDEVGRQGFESTG